jgi:hypothetical protein
VEDKQGMLSQKTQTEENLKKVHRQLRDLREEFSDAQKKEMEVTQKNKELVSSCPLHMVSHSLSLSHVAFSLCLSLSVCLSISRSLSLSVYLSLSLFLSNYYKNRHANFISQEMVMKGR